MTNPYIRKGRAIAPTPGQIEWANTMLLNEGGNTRNVWLITHGPDETGEVGIHQVPLLAAFTRWPDGLRALWRSEELSFHSLHIERVPYGERTATAIGSAAVTEVTLGLMDSSSKHEALVMKALARRVPDHQQERDLTALNAVRKAYRWAGDTSMEAPAKIDPEVPLNNKVMYEAKIVRAEFQAGRVGEQGEFVQEGRIELPLSMLQGHDVAPGGQLLYW